MKLFFMPGTCSLSPHIVAIEAGLPFELVKVNRADKRTSDDRDFLSINPRGYVPALELDDGEILTEGVAIVQYLADRAPDKRLAPPLGSMPRYHLMAVLNFITSEIHKQYTPLFDRILADDLKQAQRVKLGKRLLDLQNTLGSSAFLMGDTFTVADTYAYNVLSWSGVTHVELPESLKAYVARIDARPAVQQARSSEKHFGQTA